MPGVTSPHATWFLRGQQASQRFFSHDNCLQQGSKKASRSTEGLSRHRLGISTPSLATAAFGWSEQVTRPAHIPRVRKATVSPDGRGYKVTLQRRQKQRGMQTLLGVQQLRLLASKAGGIGSIPGRGTKISHAVQHATLSLPHSTPKRIRDGFAICHNGIYIQLMNSSLLIKNEVYVANAQS